MLLPSAHHYYIHENKSKFLFSVHPLIVAFYLAFDKDEPDMLQKSKEKYPIQEMNLYYQQYLFLKAYFLIHSEKQRACYLPINGIVVKNCFDNVNHLIFEVTDKCNLQCVYCAYGECYFSYDRRNCKNLDFSRAKILLDYFIPIWQKKIQEGIQLNITISFYGGEPLLNIKFITQIVNYCESLGFNKDFFKFSMTTNGILIKKNQKFLIDKNFQIAVSLDGDKTNHSFRINKNGENSFDEVITNLELLQEVHPDYFEKNISFIAVMHKRNSFEETLSFIKNKFNKLPSITPLLRDDILAEKKSFFENSINRDFTDDISVEILKNFTDKELRKYDVYSFVRKNARHYFNHYHDIYHAAKSIVTTSTGTCIPFTHRVYLNTNGKILPCERIHVQHTLGEVSKSKGIVLDFDAIAKYFNDTVLTFREHCKICYNRKTCEICAFKYSGEPCEKFMDKTKFSKTMFSNLTLIEAYPHTYQYIKHILTN